MRIIAFIAFIADACALREIRWPLDEPTSPPPITPAWDPPLWDMTDAERGEFDPETQPARSTSSSSALPGKRRTRPIRSASPRTACILGRCGGLVGHAATQVHPCAAIPARFTGFVGALSPNRDCFRLLAGPIRAETLPDVALNLPSFLLSLKVAAVVHRRADVGCYIACAKAGRRRGCWRTAPCS